MSVPPLRFRAISRPLLRFVAAGMALLVPVAAMDGMRAEFGILRAVHEAGMLRAALPLLKQHQAELAALEKRLAGNRDYAGAITARNERLAVAKDLARLEKEELLLRSREQGLRAALLPDQIVLMPEQAVLSGVEREAGSGALTGWKKAGASATWKLPGLPPGGYEVVIRYSCDALEGGTVLISEQTFSLSGVLGTTLKGPDERNFGTLKITNGSATFTLAARSVIKDNLMHLYYVKLLPANR